MMNPFAQNPSVLTDRTVIKRMMDSYQVVPMAITP